MPLETSVATTAHQNSDERLSAYLAPQVSAEDVPALFPLLTAQPLLMALGGLFHGGEGAVLVRLLVLRELGSRAQAPRWSRREIDAHLAFVDATKLETTLKRLTDHEILLWEHHDRTYRVSPLGHTLMAALAALLQFAPDEDVGLAYLTAQLAGSAAAGRVSVEQLQQLLARLTDLEEEFAHAVNSGSELQLITAQQRWQSVFRWMSKGTEIINRLTADNALDRTSWRIAQSIGQKQSSLMSITGVFSRELAAMARQRVHLSRGGITTTELASWLKTCDGKTLAALAENTFACVPAAVFVTPDTMLDVAEAELLRDKTQPAEGALPAASGADEASELSAPLPPELPALVARLATVAAPLPAADVVIAGDWRAAAYRFSLLPVLGETTDDPSLADLARLPLVLKQGETALLPVQRAEVAAIEDLLLEPAP